MARPLQSVLRHLEGQLIYSTILALDSCRSKRKQKENETRLCIDELSVGRGTTFVI